MASFKDTLGKKATAFGKNKLGIDTGFGELVKLKIGKDYESVLNPTNISHEFSVTYSKPDKASDKKAGGQASPAGTPSPEPLKIASTEPETLSFELLLDGTGVTGTIINVAEEIQWLSQAVYHEPSKEDNKQNPVDINWGKTINFKGSLKSFSVAYSLFDSQGNPLRAKVNLSFVGSSSLTKVTKVERKSNTQVVDLKEGSTLTTICKSVYNSPLTYIAVAKVNKLTNVRKIKPGTKLTLPPKKS